MTDFLCLDRVAREDLMLPDRLGRYLALSSERPPSVVLLGPGDNLERNLLQADIPFERKGGCVVFGSEGMRVFDSSIRTDNHAFVSRLIDSGVSAVGFTGMDRPVFRRTESSLQVADGIPILQWVETGVVPVVSTTALDDRGRISDVFPMEVAAAFRREKRGERRAIVFLARGASYLQENAQGVVWSELLERGLVHPELETCVRADPEPVQFVWHTDLIGRNQPIPVVKANG